MSEARANSVLKDSRNSPNLIGEIVRLFNVWVRLKINITEKDRNVKALHMEVDEAAKDFQGLSSNLKGFQHG